MPKPDNRTILKNSKARKDYEILETYEAGIVLRGTEVKSLRAGKAQLNDAFAQIENDEAFLYNAHIQEYGFGNRYNHDPKGRRKLLLNKLEIRKLFGLSSIKGNALVPLSLYWKRGKVKLELAVGRGKAQRDKRQDLKEKQSNRELKRALMAEVKGKS